MARIRTIKPEFWTHEDLSALPEPTHMLAAALLNHADDEGYFNANLGLVKAACSPLREPSVSIHDSLNHLVRIGYIRLGVASDGKRYGHVVEFEKHQRVNRATASKIKGLGLVWEVSVSAHAQLTDTSSPEGKGREQGTGNREGNLTTPDGVVGDSADAPSPRPPSADVLPFTGKQRAAIPAVPDCPHEEIIALYHEILPMCPPVRIWEEDRQKLLRTRWRDDAERQTLEWWRGFFDYVKSCPFLVGKKDPGPDREPFLATLEWLVRPKNFAKVIEGNYRPRARA